MLVTQQKNALPLGSIIIKKLDSRQQEGNTNFRGIAMSDLCELIKAKRESQKLSQKQLAKACCVSDSTISKIEKGSRQTPQWDTLCSIANALKFHPFEILLAAGYISNEDIHPNSKVHNLENLTDVDLEYVQIFVDSLVKRKQK